MIILRNNSHGELQEFVWEYLRPLYQEKLFLCTWKTSEWTTRSIGFFSSKLAKSDENGVYNLPIPPPPPPTHSHLPPVIWLRKTAILPGYSRFQMSEKPKQTGRKAEKMPKTESKYYSCCEQRKDMLNLNKF